MTPAQEQPRRPFSITLIALLHVVVAFYPAYFLAPAYHNAALSTQSLRATILLMLGVINHPSPEVVTHAKYVIKLVFVSVVLLALSPTLLGIAWGLWRLDKRARRHAITFHFVILAFWARAFLSFGISGGFTHVSSEVLQPVYIRLAIETFVVLILLYGNGVEEAFRDPDPVELLP